MNVTSYIRKSAALTLVLLAAGQPSSAEELSIKGRAVFKGDPKKFEPAPIAAVEGTECQLGPKLVDESLLINPTTPPTLRNVVVWIEEGPIDFRTPQPKAGVLMVIENCRFEPHVIALQEGQQLTVRNNDPFKQGARMESTKNKPRGFQMPKTGMQMNMSFDAEEPFKVISQIYDWMGAWIVVFKHPYFLVTGTDGEFEFSDFPPGEYVIKAWHEKLGQVQATINAQPGQENRIELVFEPGPKPSEPATGEK